MHIKLLVVGKTEEDYLKRGIEIFVKRLKFYTSFEIEVIPSLKDTKNLSPNEIKHKEGERILKHISPNDKIILFDEKGKEYNSLEYSSFLQREISANVKSLVFIVGGAFGFSQEVYDVSNNRIAISKMTFSHQMIRLMIVEQLYRAFTIMKNEPYHNQ
ncbi:MAG: 23S rRNA (pseudouridine(1915)-N(3))-methyltransferase RlmH [Bacteroidales bacterium]|jgi:23S rRNA (pseudouridine1915-N3)-methyltransferase|nr:23S rRNA (pseudouridine(1915)-N(3))-methyltransferase RlmH [Bacteroidales bacterium]